MSRADRNDHAHWEELAAGHALHALEPADEALFATHLDACARCRADLDEHALVAAQLASIADEGETAAPPWSRIRSALHDEPVTPDSTAPTGRSDGVVRRLIPRSPRVLAAAAAVVTIVAIGVAGWQLTSTGSHTSAPSAISQCQAAPGCHVVALLAKGKVEAGDVLVRGDTASVVPTAMPALDPAHVYVLWQLSRDGRPTPVAALGAVKSEQATPSKSLAIPYDDTVAFAMSVERADQVPTRPTKVVALGNAT